MHNTFCGFILRFVPTNSTFDGYCFDVIAHHYNSKQEYVGQLFFEKDFSDVSTLGFPDVLYDIESVSEQLKSAAEKIINTLKEKGFLH